MTLVFIDPKCLRPCDPEVLATHGLAGTEATVVREHQVTVFGKVWQVLEMFSRQPYTMKACP